jgi:hypothetical protein
MNRKTNAEKEEKLLEKQKRQLEAYKREMKAFNARIEELEEKIAQREMQNFGFCGTKTNQQKKREQELKTKRGKGTGDTVADCCIQNERERYLQEQQREATQSDFIKKEMEMNLNGRGPLGYGPITPHPVTPPIDIPPRNMSFEERLAEQEVALLYGDLGWVGCFQKNQAW